MNKIMFSKREHKVILWYGLFIEDNICFLLSSLWICSLFSTTIQPLAIIHYIIGVALKQELKVTVHSLPHQA